jgi:hypothetical protein
MRGHERAGGHVWACRLFFLGAESEKINLEQKIMSILALRINAKRLVISCVVLAEDAPASQERTG